MGIKVTNEAPVGMKAGLRASYQWVNQDMLDAVGRQEWRQMLFIMCFLHSVVQVRRRALCMACTQARARGAC